MKISIPLILCLLIFQNYTNDASAQTVSILDGVLKTKALRVGTTGDYKPFTLLENSEYSGIDIDLAKNLANTLGADVIFVKTSWPTLLADLKDNKFDIAMGGISKQLQRQQVGLFSMGYYMVGKTPISRCSDREKYGSLDKIDQSSVSLIVNPGGTNQEFVRNHIKRAKISVHRDNKSIFQQIKEGKADIMITDSLEVQMQSKIIPELCPTMPGKTFDKSEKAYLMPRDIVWKEYVDAWLAQIKLDNTLNRIIDKHL